MAPAERPVRVLRVIARMNVGGPTHHVSVLSGRLDRTRYDTLLVAGRVGRDEAPFYSLAHHYGARLTTLPSLRPEIRPHDDLRALLGLVRLIRRLRPAIVHTHTAKAGMLGRLAATIAGRPRPVIVHTYHGHVLERYFGPVLANVYRGIERTLAGVSDCLVCVSEATADDLVRLRVAPPEKFRVIPLGLELDRFLALPDRDDTLRAELGLDPDETVLVYVGRLVAIKRVDRLVRAAAATGFTLLVAGDGRLRGQLEALTAELRAPVRFLGFRADVDRLTAAADIAVLSSDNEGTPVSLIEAAAGGLPAVSTDVGGVRDVVTPDTGIVVERDDEAGLATAIAELAGDPARRRQMGRRAREHVAARYGWPRLVADVERLYDDLLQERV